jgi:ketosteroid isomerase-like protein
VTETNGEIARRTFDTLFVAEDFDAWIENFDAGVEYIPTPEWPEPAPRSGREQLKEFMRGVWDDWAEWEAEIRKVTENGDRVLVETRIRAVGEKSRIELRGRTFHVFTFRDGRIVRMQDFIEPADAKRAAGLPDG